MTEVGLQQATALGKNPRILETSFWRIYSSDLKRTQRTTLKILNLANADADVNDNSYDDVAECSTSGTIVSEDSKALHERGVRLEKRIREISKGARQGFPKSMSVDEAIDERRRLGMPEEYPLLETENDAWIRTTSWLKEVVNDAIYAALQRNLQSCEIQIDLCQDSSRKVYNVLAVGHSAVFRTFLTRIIGDERLRKHSDAKYDGIDGRFVVPNTSLTILDINIAINLDDTDGADFDKFIELRLASLEDYDPTGGVHISSTTFDLSVNIVELTSTSHYDK